MVILIKDHFGFYEIPNVELYQDESLIGQKMIIIGKIQIGVHILYFIKIND